MGFRSAGELLLQPDLRAGRMTATTGQMVAMADREIDAGEVVGWAVGLEALHAHIATWFFRPEPRRRAVACLRGLVGPVDRKNGWHLAERPGEATADAFQRLLAARWDADTVRDNLGAHPLRGTGDAAMRSMAVRPGMTRRDLAPTIGRACRRRTGRSVAASAGCWCGAACPT